jgi:predicted metal-dependent hydrolase
VTQSGKASASFSGDVLTLHLPDISDAARRKALFIRWSKHQAHDVFSQRAVEIQNRFFEAGHIIRISVRNMLTRWGSINTVRRTMSLSVHLLRCDTEIIDFIITHELCHLKHPDHSGAFYRELGARFPDYKLINKKLEEYGLVDFW